MNNRTITLPGFDDPNNRIVEDYDRVEAICEYLRGLGFKIVMTMGVYDLLHINHLEYLEDARSRADFFIVGVDSDELTRKYKPDIKNRPLVPQLERMRMVARSADLVTIHHVNDDPNYLIKIVRPDILIVSKSTKKFATKYDELKKLVGELVVLPPKGETSTTGRIRQLAREGSLELINELEEIFKKHKEGGTDQ